MEADTTGEGAIVFELGLAVAGGLVHLVAAGPGEADAGFCTAAVEAALDGAEDELAAAIGVELEVSGFDQVYELGIPELHGGDPPFADQRMVAGLGHATLVSSFGSRTRLQAAAVRVTIQPTRPRPRWRVLRKPALALIQPNGSSIRLRMRWLTA